MTPLTLHTILAALARDRDPPPDALVRDLCAISGQPIGEVRARIKRIQDDDEEPSGLPFS